MTVLCVQLEFSHAVGVPVGRYLTADGDVLMIELVEGNRTRPSRRPRRARAVAGDPVSVVLATHVRTSERDSARARLAAARHDPATAAALVDAALGVLNRAVRAARAVIVDPYLVELTAGDPRAVRIGVGSADEVHAGSWAAFEPGTPAVPKVSRAARVRLSQEVAEALAGRLRQFDAEELAQRALLDLAHGRPMAAAHQARAAHAVMREELGADGRGQAELPVGAEATETLARHVLETAAAYRAQQLEELRAQNGVRGFARVAQAAPSARV